MRVPVYTRQVSPSSPAMPEIDQGQAIASAALLGRGMGAVAQSLGDVAGTIQQIAERDRRADATIRAVNATTDAAKQLNQLQVDFSTDTDYETAVQRYDEKARAIRDQVGGQFDDPVERAQFLGHFAELDLSARNGVVNGAERQRRDAAGASLDTSIDQAVRDAANAPDEATRQAHLSRAAHAITAYQEQGLISRVDAGKRTRDMMSGVAEADAQKMIRVDPAGAEKAIADPADKRWSYIDPITRERLTRQAQIEREQQDRERERQVEDQRRALNEEARFALGSMDDGVAFAGLPDLLARADQLDPPLASALRRADTERLWYADLARQSPAEQATAIAQTRKQQASTTDARLAADYGDRAQKAENLLYRTVQALDKDPLSWAEARGVVPHTSLDPADPDTFRQRAEAAAVASHRYGVPVPVLRADEASSIVETFQRSTDPDAKLNLLSGYVLGFADPAQQREAMSALTAANLPPAAALALEKARDPLQRATARRLLGELTIKADNISMTDADLRTARQKAFDAYDSGIGAVRLGALTVTGNATWRDQMETERRAVEQVTKVRLGTDDPSGSAYRDLYGDKQTIADEGFAFVAFPAAAKQRDQVETGLMTLRSQAAAKVMAAAPESGQERRRLQDLADDTASSGTWVNWGDDRTFALIVPGAQKPVALSNGDPWVVTLDEVIQAAAAAAPADRPDRWFDRGLGILP